MDKPNISKLNRALLIGALASHARLPDVGAAWFLEAIKEHTENRKEGKNEVN